MFTTSSYTNNLYYYDDQSVPFKVGFYSYRYNDFNAHVQYFLLYFIAREK